MIQSVLGALRLAILALSRNKTRGVLTILGILIGTAAVVTITALAEGASARVAGEIDGFGANLLMISPQAVQASGARSKDQHGADSAALVLALTTLAAVFPESRHGAGSTKRRRTIAAGCDRGACRTG